MKRLIGLMLIIIFAATFVSAEIQTEEVQYSAGEVTLKGYRT